MDFKQIFCTNKDKEQDGAWVMLEGGVEVKVKRAGMGNKPFEFDRSKMFRPFNKQIMAGTMEPDILRQIHTTLLAKHIIVDWKGILEDGKPVKFSKEKFIEFANMSSDFLQGVLTAANEQQNFQDGEESEIVKKPVSSTGTA
jgi:hypothetical protein